MTRPSRTVVSDILVLSLLSLLGIAGYETSFGDLNFLVAAIAGLVVGTLAAVAGVVWRLGVVTTVLLALAAAVEEGSAHPLARAIVAAAAERNVLAPPAEDARAVPGRAVEATVEGRRVAVGSPRHAAEAGLGLAPGNAFAPEAQGWLRWCFASKDLSRLEEGVRRLKGWLEPQKR